MNDAKQIIAAEACDGGYHSMISGRLSALHGVVYALLCAVLCYMVILQQQSEDDCLLWFLVIQNDNTHQEHQTAPAQRFQHG